jgi:regulator of sigma E protease
MDILINYIWPGIVFLFTLVILVVIHEFGHFILCKFFNIKVLEFGFGIPPRAWAKKVGETIVSINWLPFGGFVRPLGEDEDVELSKLSPQEKKEWKERSFQTQDVGKRIMVVVAGVLMNLFLAWVLFYIVIIGHGFKVIIPPVEPVVTISYIEPGFPAASSPLKIGDRILKINGQESATIEGAIKKLRSSDQNGVDLTISDLEGKNPQIVHIVGKEVPEGGRRVGVALSPVVIKEYKTLPEKIFSGVTYSWDITRITFQGLGRAFGYLGQRNLEKASEGVGGPIAIAVVTKNIVSLGWQATLDYLWFAGILSLTLFVFNILPIPALDGGRLFFLLIEAISGKKVNPETEKKIHAIGMALLLTLIIAISFKDINSFILPAIRSFFKI